MTSLEIATKLVNIWTSECISLSPSQHGIRLIQMIAETLDKSEQQAYERGVENGKALSPKLRGS